MRYIYNKLVRDKIPAIINSQKGKRPNWRVMEREEYIEELSRKLVEEAYEFLEDNNIEGLADIMEVIESIMTIKDITFEDIKKHQLIKRNEKGGFGERVYLIDVEEDDIINKRKKQKNKK